MLDMFTFQYKQQKPKFTSPHFQGEQLALAMEIHSLHFNLFSSSYFLIRLKSPLILNNKCSS